MSDPIHQLSTEPTETTSPAESDTPERRGWDVNYPMRFKLIIALLAVALIPLGIFSYTNYQFIQDLLAEVAYQSLTAATAETADHLDTFIQSNQDTLREVAKQEEVTEYVNQLLLLQSGLSEDSIELERARVRAILQELQDHNEYGADYALLGRLGNDLVNNIETDLDKPDVDYVSVPFNTNLSYVSPIQFDPTTGKAFWYFSAPVLNTKGRRSGLTAAVLRVRYNADVLQQLIEEHNELAGPLSFPVLLDENDVILANGTEPEMNFKSIVPLAPDQVTRLQAEKRLPSGTAVEISANLADLKENLDKPNNPSFSTQLDANGKASSFAAVKTLDTPPWRIVFLQPQDAFSKLVRQQIFTIAVILLVIVVFVFVATLNVSRILTNPLVRLSAMAQQVASGALGLHVPVESRDEVGELAKAFNGMTAQMRDLSGNLEQYISERTRALGNIVRSLETSTHIGRQITTILDINELLRYVVNRIQIEFNFYYTQIYLVEEETGDLVIAEGSGDVGRELKAQDHRLPAGQGIVGTVAGTNEYFLSNDVSKSLNFVSSPLLPDTRSELALPLRKGNRVLGVLDIQDDKINRFTSADISLMQSIANQTAVAVDNARLLAEAQTALKEVERLNRRLTREGWDEFSEQITTPGYRFSRGSSIPISSDANVWLPPMKQAAVERQLVKDIRQVNGDSTEAELAVPLVLRGEVIGVLGVKREEIEDWADEEVAAVEAVANQVALALENARLSREQEKTISQLKEVDRIKSEFLTSMSHELRTPLNSIIGFADVILQGIDGEVSETALNDVRLIYNSGQHLLALINDILDLAKIEAGKMELVREPLSVEEVINDVLAGASSLVKNKPVEIVTDITESLPAIYADKLRFNQILLNLVSNAVKFTKEGTITIKAHVWRDNPNQALISVVDQGVGIPSRMLGTIFDRFRQIDGATTRKAEGTGLGLAICKQLVEMHDGIIGVTSKEGTGSDFHFTIPFVGVVSEDELAVTEVSN